MTHDSDPENLWSIFSAEIKTMLRFYIFMEPSASLDCVGVRMKTENLNPPLSSHLLPCASVWQRESRLPPLLSMVSRSLPEDRILLCVSETTILFIIFALSRTHRVSAMELRLLLLWPVELLQLVFPAFFSDLSDIYGQSSSTSWTWFHSELGFISVHRSKLLLSLDSQYLSEAVETFGSFPGPTARKRTDFYTFIEVTKQITTTKLLTV